MTSQAATKLTADMQRFLDAGARQARQAHDRLWGTFLDGYAPMTAPVSVSLLKDLYPFFGNAAALGEKIWDAAFLIEAEANARQPSEALRELLLVVAQNSRNNAYLGFVARRSALPDLETKTYHLTHQQAQAWQVLQDFVNFLEHMDRRFLMRNYHVRQEELAAMNDAHHHRMFHALGVYLRAARV